jgi:hypothetical protein
MNSAQPTIFVAPGGIPNQGQAGSVGINTTKIPAGYKLAVMGKIIAEELLIKSHTDPPWPPDYVFDPGYPLMPLGELEDYLAEHCHLPEVPPAEEMMQQGVAVHEMQFMLLKKVEELTLYILKQQEEIDALRQRLNLQLNQK